MMKEKKAEAEAAKKAAAEAEAEDAEIIEAEFEDADPKVAGNTNEGDPTDEAVKEYPEQNSSGGDMPLPDEAHDLFELIDTLETEEAIMEVVDKIKDADWFTSCSEKQKADIADRINEKRTEVTGE